MLQPRGAYIYCCALSGSCCVNIAETQDDYCDYPTVMFEVFVCSTALMFVYFMCSITLTFFNICVKYHWDILMIVFKNIVFYSFMCIPQ
jgi:hypothetical protein